MARTGRPREFDREKALEQAMLVFWRKGFAPTSMHDLCDAMHIASPSLYAAFGSKEGLYVEAVECYVRTHGPLIWGHLVTAATARSGVEQFLRAAAQLLPENGSEPGGCMATIAVGEEFPPAVLSHLRRIRGQCLDMLRSRMADGIAKGELSPSTDLDHLSRFYLGVYQGMSTQARDGANAADLERFVEFAMAAWPAQT